jgi:Family of unknown function (DUF5343)
MADTTKQLSPPYATFGQFISFLNKLRETGIPSRIDPTVFGNASGAAYSIISALKFLKLVDESGAPSKQFTDLVKATDDSRGALLKPLIQKGYPSLFTADVDLTTMTAGQFDEHFRLEYGISGSTVDKVALFFTAACRAADIPLSAHIQSRKPIATSSSAKKSVKQRRNGDQDRSDGETDDPPPPPASVAKALEYQLIDLMSEPDIDDGVKASIWSLVQYLTARKAKKSATGEE